MRILLILVAGLVLAVLGAIALAPDPFKIILAVAIILALR